MDIIEKLYRNEEIRIFRTHVLRVISDGFLVRGPSLPKYGLVVLSV